MHRLQGLYAVTDDTLLSGRLVSAVQAALQGGCRVVQYRSKQADVAARCREASDLVAVCHAADALLLVNDDVALAKAVRADGVHLGQDDMALQDARRLLGPDAIIGVTCHASLRLAEAAAAAGADYVAFGRFFGSSTKPSAPFAPVTVLSEARRHIRCPLVAIGGITLDNAQELVAAGAYMLAVVGGLFGSAGEAFVDVEARSRAFQALYSDITRDEA